MPAATGVPPRRPLVIAFCVYAASTLISQAVMSLAAGLLGLALALDFAFNRGEHVVSHHHPWRRPAVRAYSFASLGLCAAIAISLLVAQWAPMGWNDRFLHTDFWINFAKSWYFAWALVLWAGLRRLSEKGRALVLRTWLLTLAVVSIIGVIQYYTGWPRAQAIPFNEGRFHSTLFLGHHLSVASILIFPFFASLDILKTGARSGVLPPWLATACAILGFAALFLSYSRMLWIALPFGLVVWALRALPRQKAVAAVCVLVLGVLGATQIPVVNRRIQDSMGAQAIGVSERERLWSANFEFLRLRPLTGTGFRLNNEASGLYLESLPDHGYVFTGHAHNNLIEMLGGTGALGALTWLAWCLVVTWLMVRALRTDGGRPQGIAWGLLCAWIVFQLNGLTQVNFWEGKVMHQMIWAVAWTLFRVTDGDRRAVPRAG
jgi:O-antigen ligase